MSSRRVFSSKSIETLKNTFWDHHLTFNKEFLEYLELYPELRDFYESLSSHGFSKEYYQSILFALLLTHDYSLGLRQADFFTIFDPPNKLKEIADRLNLVPTSIQKLKKISAEIGKVDSTDRENTYLLFSEQSIDCSREKVFYLSPKLWEILYDIIENILASPEQKNHLIGLYTFRSPTELESRSMNKVFDFSRFFSPMPSEENWITIQKGLKNHAKDLRASNMAIDDSNIKFRCNAHQTLGLIIGHTFYKSKLETYQSRKFWSFEEQYIDDDVTDHWDMNYQDSNLNGLNVSNLILVINVTRNLNSFVNLYLQENPIDNSCRYTFSVKGTPSRNSIRNQQDASQKIKHLANFINKIWDDHPINRVHLFIRAPFAFLVMFGAYFANLVDIQVYEQRREDLHFHSTALLPIRGSNPELIRR